MRKIKKTASWLLAAVMLAGAAAPVQNTDAAVYWKESGVKISQYGAGEEASQEQKPGGDNQQQTTEKLTSEEATTQEATTQESSSEDLTTEEKTTQEPSTEEKTTEEKTTQQPGTTETTTEQTTENQPVEEKPQRAADIIDTGLSPLTAKVIVIDPGHCGRHSGARGNGLKEEVVVLDIAQACQRKLETYGDVTVYMTREDGSCCAELNLGDCLGARNNYAKKLDADFLVSMHINAGGTNGANVLTAYRSGYNNWICDETQAFGRIALSKLSELGIKNRGLLLRKSGTGNRYSNGKLADYYSIVRKGVIQQIPSVIIEHGYITSSSDCSKFFKTKAKRKIVGEADADAIISYYNLSKSVVNGRFTTVEGSTYYVTANNMKAAGWVKADGSWYYFDEFTGKMQTGFLTIGEETFYLSPNTGEMITGWFTVDGKKYLSKGNGTIVKNQIYSDGQYNYLFDVNGQTAEKGFYNINGAAYYADSKGRLASGMVKIGSSKYYFDSLTGKMKKGWIKVNKKYYYFSKTTGKMQKSKWIGRYYVNSKGIRTKKK